LNEAVTVRVPFYTQETKGDTRFCGGRNNVRQKTPSWVRIKLGLLFFADRRGFFDRSAAPSSLERTSD
jgi:hypothetical protein